MNAPSAAALQIAGYGDDLLLDLARVIVLTVLAGSVGFGAGVVYRWYATIRIPDGLSVLLGLSAVALYLNTAGTLGDIVGGQQDILAVEAAIFNVVTFFVAAGVAAGGGRLGDRVGIGLFAATGARSVDGDVNRLVRTVGRVISVEIPEEIDDVEGYDPVDVATKESLAGRTLLFPRRLTVEELRSRFVERLRTDYGVGHVDVDLAEDGTIEYLALGSRESGLGPTLPPGSAAVAVRADPANNASPGDVVQLWRPGKPPERVTSAELRGTAGDVATLAMDEADARQLDTGTRYRLATLPVEARVDREFAAQLRAAEETMGAVSIAEGSSLARETVGSIDAAVIAVRTLTGELEAIPSRNRPLVAGETVYVIARPDRIRRLESDAAAPDGRVDESDPDAIGEN